MSTALANTKELNPVKMAQMLDTPSDAFQDVWGPRSVTLLTNSSAALSTSFEEMFRIITISLMGSSLLQPNLSVTNPPDVKVTMSTDRTVYTYSVSILWTAYGIAIGATLISALMGMFAFTLNHGSYSTKFSTIFRATQYASISTDLKAEDCSGKDPLPGYIASWISRSRLGMTLKRYLKGSLKNSMSRLECNTSRLGEPLRMKRGGYLLCR